MIVSMRMSTPAKMIDPFATLPEAILEMARNKIRRLVVADASGMHGIVCYRDIVMAYPDNVNPFTKSGIKVTAKAQRIEEIMKRKVATIKAEKPLEDAAALMSRYHIGGLPVIGPAGDVVGIITESDVFRAFSLLLGGEHDSARITFDLSRGEAILPWLVEASDRLDLDIRSFVTFKDGDRPMAVARVSGDRSKELIEELWDSGHSVVNVVTD